MQTLSKKEKMIDKRYLTVTSRWAKFLIEILGENRIDSKLLSVIKKKLDYFFVWLHIRTKIIAKWNELWYCIIAIDDIVVFFLQFLHLGKLQMNLTQVGTNYKRFSKLFQQIHWVAFIVRVAIIVFEYWSNVYMYIYLNINKYI